MAPKRGTTVKPRPEHERWDWVESFQKSFSQEDILQEHIHQAYGIDATKCERGSCRINCKKNPNCHNHLGEKFWSNEIKDSYWVDVEDPEEQRKTVGSHVGLKNLGATCYVNTFLQLWFHNPDFRSAIFKWIPSEGYSNPPDDAKEDSQKSEESKSEVNRTIPVLHDLSSPTFGSSPADTICGNLQLLFALMKYGERKYVDPTPFVQSLGLQTDEQQDAQEFSKLFMSLLESSLSNQHDSLKHLVQDQYGGRYAYETRCTVCGKVSKTLSNFYELDLNIQGHLLLRECIKEFLKEEKLNGDNKYYCTKCHIKQDATRRIVLQSLPRVLNLQLLRFVFDRETGSKRKCNTMVRFPELLDMNDFMQQDDPSQGIYELSAVLIHCGLSAYSGHYVAHILDRKDEAWYRFNDETVEKMKGKKLELGTEEDPEDGGKLSKKTKNVKGQHFSKNAYMLVYTKRDGGATDSRDVEPPDFIQNYVATSNSVFESWVAKMRMIMDMKIEEGRMRCREVLETYGSLHPDCVIESEWIATDWLRKWLNEKQPSIVPVDNTSLMCKHGRLDASKIHLSKRISTKSADRLFAKYGGLPRLRYDSLCRTCVYNQAKRMQFDKRLNTDKQIISLAAKANYTGSDGFWVGKSSLRQWKQMAIDAQNFECMDATDGIIGEPGTWSSKICSKRAIAVKDEKTSVQSEVRKDNELKPNDVGYSCALDELIMRQNGMEMDIGNEVKSSILNNAEEEFDESIEESNNAIGMRENTFNSDAQCRNHGNLCIEENKRCLVSTKVWSCLKYYFKDCPEFSADVEPCLLCQEQSAKKQKRREVLRSVANCMRDSLRDLYQNHSRPELYRETTFEVYAVSRYTIDSWRRFLRCVSSQPYDLIENADLFCEHSKLLYNSEDFFNHESNKEYILVTKDEWNTLTDLVPFDREIKLSNCNISPENDHLQFSISYDCCTECRMIRIAGEKTLDTQFFNAPIYIRKVVDDHKSSSVDENIEFVQDAENVDSCEKFNKKQSSKKRKLFEPVEGQRKSARHRMQRGEYMLKVHSSQTLKEVKIQLIPIFSVIPCDQHLSFLDGTPLEDDSSILSDLGVIPGSILLLRVDEPSEKAPTVETVHANGQRRLEEGFKGTGLCGVFQSDQNAAS